MINSDECVKYRLECLKMAYEFNFKIGNIKTNYTNEEEITNDLQDVFALADMNTEFIINGIMPEYLYLKRNNSNISKIEEETKK